MMTGVKNLFSSLVTNPFGSAIWSMLAFGVAGMAVKEASMNYAESKAEWKAVQQTCTGGA